MFARLLAFSNGDLQALYDRSDGFYRRQLVLTTKEKQVDRADDPDLAEKMKAEAEGIFLWVFEGLQRLVANNFKFTAVSYTHLEAIMTFRSVRKGCKPVFTACASISSA